MSTNDLDAEPWSPDFDRYLAVMDSRPEYRELQQLVWWEPERAWPVLLQLVDELPDDLLEHLGAGELESFVKRHAAAFIDRIEARARADSRFLEALECIWLTDGAIPADAQRRLLEVTSDRILILSPNEEEEG